jgi:hypothetical protein
MKLYILLLSFISLHAFAEEEFQPYMIGHEVMGCPENSYCNKELAKKQMSWNNAVNALSKNKFAQLNHEKNQTGAPLNFYFATPDPKKAGQILWDSRCENHKKATPKIYEARNFFKKLPTQDKTENAYFTSILVEKPNSTQKITISRGDFPLFYQNDSVHINREENGVYYGVIINASGEFKITPPIETKLVPQEVKCPQSLMDKIRILVKNKSVYTSAICRKIWDRKNEVFYTYAIADACF